MVVAQVSSVTTLVNEKAVGGDAFRLQHSRLYTKMGHQYHPSPKKELRKMAGFTEQDTEYMEYILELNEDTVDSISPVSEEEEYVCNLVHKCRYEPLNSYPCNCCECWYC